MCYNNTLDFDIRAVVCIFLVRKNYHHIKYGSWRLALNIERLAFESTITRLNEFFAYCEDCIVCIIAYLFVPNRITKKTLREIAKFVASQNKRTYNPKELEVINIPHRAFRVIEMTFIDHLRGTRFPLSHSNEEFFMQSLQFFAMTDKKLKLNERPEVFHICKVSVIEYTKPAFRQPTYFAVKLNKKLHGNI
uniref:Uncharacterized protein n=1 Tax=Glossina brevipalpis TaxID=37001 RepID=A0A1A9WYP2_9MUSC